MAASMEQQEALYKMVEYKKILDNEKEYLERPEIGYYLLIKNIKSEKKKQSFFKRMHERTRLCHPVFHQRQKEEGYRETVRELLKYFLEKYQSYEEVVRACELRRVKQEAFKKEVEKTREFLKTTRIERELSQIDFSKLTEVYNELSQIDFGKNQVIYADLLEIEKLALL